MGSTENYKLKAQAMGKLLAAQKITTVYGGAKIGLMGAIADAAIDNGGKVIGVLPKFLSAREIAHTGLHELFLVENMHERKAKMYELSDGFIAMPGGFGTLEELFEMLTWGQIGLHLKPIGIYNVDGYYDHLITQLDLMVEAGFLKQEHRNMITLSDNATELLHEMGNYISPIHPNWINDLDKT